MPYLIFQNDHILYASNYYTYVSYIVQTRTNRTLNRCATICLLVHCRTARSQLTRMTC